MLDRLPGLIVVVPLVIFAFIVGGRGPSDSQQRAPQDQRQNASCEAMKAVHGRTMTDRT
jgi:hypothetical protein